MVFLQCYCVATFRTFRFPMLYAADSLIMARPFTRSGRRLRFFSPGNAPQPSPSFFGDKFLSNDIVHLSVFKKTSTVHLFVVSVISTVQHDRPPARILYFDCWLPFHLFQDDNDSSKIFLYIFLFPIIGHIWYLSAGRPSLRRFCACCCLLSLARDVVKGAAVAFLDEGHFERHCERIWRA